MVILSESSFTYKKNQLKCFMVRIKSRAKQELTGARKLTRVPSEIRDVKKALVPELGPSPA